MHENSETKYIMGQGFSSAGLSKNLTIGKPLPTRGHDENVGAVLQ